MRIEYAMHLFQVQRNGLWGYCDKDGHVQIPIIYEYAGPFHEGLAAAKLGDNYGFIDTSGSWVIKPSYKEAHSFADQLASCSIEVEGQDLSGYIDKRGTWVIKPAFFRADHFSNGLATVMLVDQKNVDIMDRKNSVINRSGQLLQLDGDVRGSYCEGLAHAKDQKGLLGFLNESGKWAIAPQFDDVTGFSEGLAAASGELWGFINKSGAYVLPQKWMQIQYFSEGLCAVDEGTGAGWQYIDKSGEYPFHNSFYECGNFKCGLAPVRNEPEGKTEFINTVGKLVFKCRFEDVTDFENDRARVFFGSDGVGLIDKSGKLVFKP
jgi:hypothetical protein